MAALKLTGIRELSSPSGLMIKKVKLEMAQNIKFDILQVNK